MLALLGTRLGAHRCANQHLTDATAVSVPHLGLFFFFFFLGLRWSYEHVPFPHGNYLLKPYNFSGLGPPYSAATEGPWAIDASYQGNLPRGNDFFMQLCDAADTSPRLPPHCAAVQHRKTPFVWQRRRSLSPFQTDILAPCRPTRAVGCSLLGTHVPCLLIGASNQSNVVPPFTSRLGLDARLQAYISLADATGRTTVHGHRGMGTKFFTYGNQGRAVGRETAREKKSAARDHHPNPPVSVLAANPAGRLLCQHLSLPLSLSVCVCVYVAPPPTQLTLSCFRGITGPPSRTTF